MGGSAPKADPNIGIAAKKSAETGESMMNFMRDQAKITNSWAGEDRSRYTSTFMPMQDAFIADAKGFASPDRTQAAADTARADVALASQAADGTRTRQAMAMGINPMSGRFANAGAKASVGTALASAGAGNAARRSVEDQGRAMKASAINMGSGLGINPGTSMGISNGAMGAGGSAAMSGYGQQGSLLNADYSNRMAAWQANNQGMGAIGGALGSLAGMFWPSSKEFKTNKEPFDGALGAINAMPVEKWDYKSGMGDGGSHIGPYAEDFHAATGMGNGKSIDALSAMGLTMAAVQELSHEVGEIRKSIASPTAMGVLEEDGMPEVAEDAAEAMPQAMGVMTGKKKPAAPMRRMAA